MTKKKAKKKPTATQEPDPPQDASGSLQPDLRLPPRLFATDRFPTKRLNIYSSPEILPFLRHVLRDTKEFQIIRESCFGKLFDIPARQCPVSAKLIHSFLTRQLLCLPKNTLWSVFGGNPLRYGLQEFGTVTGLNCASFPEGYHPDTAKSVVAGKEEIWKRLFGKKKIVTIAELSTPNAFAATASTSPPVIGRPTSAEESQGYDDGVIDLTQTKDLPRHVPSMEENHLANELFRYPLIPVIALITPLPQMEWDLFENILKANINVYHTTQSELEFFNKSLLQIAEPKQWTTTYQMELLVHMLSTRHSDILQREHAAFAPPTLAKLFQENYVDFSKSRKKNTFSWDKNLVDIVLLPGKKWMEDALLQINRLLDDKTTSSGTNDNSTIATEDTLQSPNLASDANNSRSQVINITVAAIALGTMAWRYAKITN
ncbi:hypothetical protein F2Q68_00045499 [Brassica cretica]|uniref:DUF1985 domain-containing protein n=1 Tax=Brassica cretica TaxID=69181 RepID=A0A8S9LRD1_BRACR|nr:hypothetical protein F2Q68_00045499 [Brassica cretica]